MRKSSVWQCSILFLASLVLSGCVTVPDSIKGHSAVSYTHLTLPTTERV